MSLTPLQLNAAAGLLQNEGFGVSANLIAAISSYENTTLIVPFLNTISVGSIGNILSANVIASIETLAANTCPALSDSVPTAYSSLGTQMITVVIDQANIDICGNNTSKLIQAVNQIEAYTSQTSIFINSAVNSQTYLGNTFTTMNDTITGSATVINLSTPALGTDLENLGQLINLKDLNNFGSPLALVQQLYLIAGAVSTVTAAFITAGVSTDVVLNITSPTVSVTDSTEKLMYQAMTQITGTDLNQILSVLGVVTVGITTMADLLNPLKLFPNSFQSLTAPTANGPVAIYIDSVGSINTNLIRQLPPYVISSLV